MKSSIAWAERQPVSASAGFAFAPSHVHTFDESQIRTKRLIKTKLIFVWLKTREFPTTTKIPTKISFLLSDVLHIYLSIFILNNGFMFDRRNENTKTQTPEKP